MSELDLARWQLGITARPNVLPSTTAAAYSLTVHNASSSHYTLTVMTWVALIFTPVVPREAARRGGAG